MNDVKFAFRQLLKNVRRMAVEALAVPMVIGRISVIVGIAWFSLVPNCDGEATPKGETSAAGSGLSPEQAQADFDFMLRVLDEAHPGLNRYSTKRELDAKFAAERVKLEHPMTKSECFEVFAETVALIKCGHTSLNPSEDVVKNFKAARLFPFQVAVENLRLVVKSNETPSDPTIVPGMEILEINGNKVPELLHRFQRVESSDGDIETSQWMHIQRGFAMYYWFLIEQPLDFTIKARNAAGVTVETKVAGVTRDQLGKSGNPVNNVMRTALSKLDWSGPHLALRFLKEPEIAEIRIPTFAMDDFKPWIENTFKILREKGAKSLIIDLRGNGGGPDMNGAMLVSCLTDKPFRYFERITAKTCDPSFKAQADWSDERTSELRKELTPNPAGGYFVKHLGNAKQNTGRYPFTGKVIVLIDGGVFSTAADVCAVTHHINRATFIGEETGGGYYGNNSGSFAYVTLPKSKFEMRLPLYSYWNAVSPDAGTRRGTLPDRPVKTSVATLLRGIDEPLEAALSLAQLPGSGG
jgi:hypothetical protein